MANQNALRGTLVVGAYKGSGVVTKASGEHVPGFHYIEIDVGHSRPRRVTYSEEDMDTGEPTFVHQQMANLKLQPGEEIAVKVVPRASGRYVNLDAVRIERLGNGTTQKAS